MRKRGLVWQTLIPWIIALAVLALIFFLYKILAGKGLSAIDYFKNLWKYGK